jgi:FkbM family methyltransferase
MNLKISILDKLSITWTEMSVRRNMLTALYEPIQLEIFARLVERVNPSAVIDVGANIGVYGIIAASIHPEMKVDLFEASAETAKECRANIQINALEDRVFLHQIAASSSSRKVVFWDEGNLSGRNSVVSTTIHRTDVQFENEVQAMPIDTILKYSGKTLLIKIDTEGHEADVLTGASDLLSNNQCIIQCENGYKNNGQVHAILKEKGYSNVIRIGPDMYASNMPSGPLLEIILPVVEEGIQVVLSDRLKANDEIISLSSKISTLEGASPFRQIKERLIHLRKKIAIRTRIRKISN